MTLRRGPVLLSAIALALLALAPALPQTVLTLEEASRRQPGSFAAVHDGKRVSLYGTIAAAPVQILNYTHVIIQDDKTFGITLEFTGPLPVTISPGDVVQASGVITHRSGLAVLRVDSLEKNGALRPPAVARLDAGALNGFRHLGKLVEVRAFVLSSGQNAGGDVVLAGERGSNFAIFYPRNTPESGPGLRRFQPGDKILVRGISSQYCPMQPYDRGFQIIVGDPAAVTLLNHGWIVAPEVLYYGVFGLLGVFAIWWVRERQAAAQRRVSRRMMELSEELLTAPTAVELAQKIETALPPLLSPGVTFLNVFNRGAKSLERVPTTSMPERHSSEVDSPIGTLAAAAALCFRNRALLEIPNTRKSPLVNSLEIGNVRGALFVPLFAQSEPVGVLAIHYHHPVRRLSAARRTGMQHLGNMIAASLRLQEQQWMRDQLFRSEKMAAAGQLISGVANDLREPLAKIGDVARQALQSGNANGSVLQDIDQAARHGVEIVQHLLAFSRMERSEPRPLDIFSLVSSLVEMRQLECAAKGVHLKGDMPVSHLQVMGDQVQLEQVFLSLLLYAEQNTANSQSKQILVAGRPIGKRVLITISHSRASAPTAPTAELPSAIFDPRVCHALIQGHAGELRLSSEGEIQRAEVDLPLYQPATIGLEEASVPVRKAARLLTALLVEPDAGHQRKISTFLAVRNHRVVPVDNYDAAVEAVQRFRFDIVLCTDRIGETTWVDFFQRVRRKVSAFVLVTEIDEMGTGPAFRSGEAFILRKPLDENEFDNLLKMVEADEPARK